MLLASTLCVLILTYVHLLFSCLCHWCSCAQVLCHAAVTCSPVYPALTAMCAPLVVRGLPSSVSGRMLHLSSTLNFVFPLAHIHVYLYFPCVPTLSVPCVPSLCTLRSQYSSNRAICTLPAHYYALFPNPVCRGHPHCLLVMLSFCSYSPSPWYSCTTLNLHTQSSSLKTAPFNFFFSFCGS